MPKFYCKSGSYTNIVDAEDISKAMLKSVTKALKKNLDFGVLMAISERGFNNNELILSPIIPVLKKMGFEKTNGEWIDLVCDSLNMSLEDICPKQLKWLVTGIIEENNK